MVGFSDLFSKSGRRIINAKYDYEKCERLIKDSKASFRQNFARDIIFQYPDCKILMNHCDDIFFALIPSKRSLLYGGFADYYFPDLRYRYNENKVNLAELSVREFKEEISNLIGVIRDNYKSELERGLMSRPDEFHNFIKGIRIKW
ncbi:hypothetical protein [Martelella mediterranea]|uniref:Uncharacterized protein n=1 Tax=Martelella mediterranea TaxID=293089 RepID=A0A4R3NMW3_9HYPH|nr:hypothetical protein [Martelella mediterranea]TCT36064.1 hypothetical protein EDC90_102448 [Martelella mediterranea]